MPRGTAPVIVARILLASKKLDALEDARIAISNSAGALRREGVLDTDTLGFLDGLALALKDQEKVAALELQRAVRKHPLHPWITSPAAIGVGERQAGRFLASLGNCDPAYNDASERPRRGPAELWAYCGFHVHDGRRPQHARGVQSNWNPIAKMRARLMAESCIKHRRSPYRDIYDRERAKWGERDTTDAHRHNHALAVVAKEILKDMWREMNALP